MPQSYFRSDVYYVEQDLSQAIAGVASSIGAIVIAARKGPVTKRMVTTPEQFIDKYGKPDASISFGGFCALAFLEFSNQLWVRRVVGCCAKWGGLAIASSSAASQTQLPGDQTAIPFSAEDPDVNGIAWSTVSPAPDHPLLAFYAEGPGSYSRDLEIEIVSTNLVAPTNIQVTNYVTMVDGIPLGGGTLPVGTYEYGITARNLEGESEIGIAAASIGIGQTPIVKWDAQAGAIGYNVYRRVAGSANWSLLNSVGAGTPYFVDKGVTPAQAVATPRATVSDTREFTVLVYDTTVSKNNPVESFNCSLRDNTNGMGEQTEITQQINGVSQWIRVSSNIGSLTNTPLIFSMPRTKLAAGDSGSAVMASDVNQGWNDFTDDEDVEVRILINGGYAIPSVQLKMDALCHHRMDCIAVLDVPANKQGTQQAIDYRNITLNLNSNRSALYASDVFVEDEYTGKRLYVPPSGHVAGVYAYTDSVTYPWFAPAGLNRGQLRVLGVRHKYEKGERDALWRNQVNYIRDIKGLGRVVWEQRTLQNKQSGFSFVNVRRMMDVISVALRRSLMWQEFEPNDDFLRLQIRTMIEDYLRTIQQARGIREYLVVCDDRNNTPGYTDQGQLNVDILIKPVLPAEKIRLRGTLTSQGADFSELLAAGAVAG